MAYRREVCLEQKAVNALESAFDNRNFTHRVFAYFLTHCSPAVQKDFWRVSFEVFHILARRYHNGPHSEETFELDANAARVVEYMDNNFPDHLML